MVVQSVQTDSILQTTKKVLGLDVSYTVFDQDIMMHINSAFSTLAQLGVGPEYGFEISSDAENWTDYLGGDLRYNSVKTYVQLRARLLFDPPTVSQVATAMEAHLKELEWRLNVLAETSSWNPTKKVPDGTELAITAGLPFNRRIRVKGIKVLWATLKLFEVKMPVGPLSEENDLSNFINTYYDGDDIVMDLVLTGQDSAAISGGYYEILLSDVNDVDVQAIRALYGQLTVLRPSGSPGRGGPLS